MGNNIKIIMLGSVSAADVERALCTYGAGEVSVTPSSIPHRSRINFKQAGDGEDRLLIVYETDSYREGGLGLHQGMHTLAMLGAWGEHEKITTALFQSFDGYILEETPLGHRRISPNVRQTVLPVAPEPVDLVQAAAESAADAIAKILGPDTPARTKLVLAIANLLS